MVSDNADHSYRYLLAFVFVFSRNVKQFLLEWHIFPKHPPRESFSQLIATIRDLQEAGFKAFDKHPHPVTLDWEKFNLQSDIGYVNVNFTKS